MRSTLRRRPITHGPCGRLTDCSCDGRGREFRELDAAPKGRSFSVVPGDWENLEVAWVLRPAQNAGLRMTIKVAKHNFPNSFSRYQTRHWFTFTIGWPDLQWNAS